MTTSRPVEGVLIRYFCRVRILGHATSGPDTTGSSARAAGGAAMPRAGIECRPQRMVKALARTPRSLAALVPSALLLVVLGGCSIKHPTADLVRGKQLFVQKCGA